MANTENDVRKQYIIKNKIEIRENESRIIIIKNLVDVLGD